VDWPTSDQWRDYFRSLRIEEQLGSAAFYPGIKAFTNLKF